MPLKFVFWRPKNGSRLKPYYQSTITAVKAQGRGSKLSAPKSRDSLRLRRRFLPLPTRRDSFKHFSVSSNRCSRKRRRRYQECVRNASKMRQNESCFIGKRGTFLNASEMSQKCINMRRTPLGENTFWTIPNFLRTLRSKIASERQFSLRLKLGDAPEQFKSRYV